MANSPAQVNSLAYGNGTFVGYGGGMWFVSHDGANWTINETPPIIYSAGVVYGNGVFLAFGTNTQNKVNYILQSTNGINWTQIYASSNLLFSAAYGNNTWVFIGANEIVTAKGTSTNWTWIDYQPTFTPACIIYGNGVFVIGSKASAFNIFSSSDGITWQYNSSLTGYSSYAFTGITYGNGVFAITANVYSSGFFDSVFVSTNLVNWALPFGNQFWPVGSYQSCLVAFGGGQFFTLLQRNGTQGNSTQVVYSSLDGNIWSTNIVSEPSISTLTYGQGTFVAVGYYNNIYQSAVFASQSNLPATLLGISTYPGVTINGTAGAVYQIQYSTSLNSTWQTLTNFMLPYSPYLWVDTSSTVSGQRFYRSVQLQ